MSEKVNSNTLKKHALRVMVRGAYDLQKLRVQTGNRIVGNFKAKLGQEPSKPEGSIDAEGQKILNNLRVHYRRITDGIVTFPRYANFVGDEVISTYTELCLIAGYMELEAREASEFRRLGTVLREYPIYTQFLEGVRGCGSAMSGVIISEIDIHKATYASSIWRYAGLDVAPDGRGRGRTAEHLIDTEYTDKDGKPATRKGITFNPFLKTKLIGVLASSFLRSSSPYRTIYDDYKHRLENHEIHKGKSIGHRHNMAMRYMIKRFLADLYEAWRKIEGLPVHNDYFGGKLGGQHKKTG